MHVNRTFSDLLGYTVEELLQLNFQKVTHSDDLKLTYGPMSEILAASRESIRVQKRYICKDGSIVWGALMSGAVRNEQGELRYMISVVEDITEQKRVHQALAES